MQTIILYGRSLALSSVGACLDGREGLRVVHVGTGLLGTARGTDELRPDVVIFDVTAMQPGFAVELLRSKPGLLLIGVDLANRRALVLSSQTSRVLTTDDLVHVIESYGDTHEAESTTESLAGAVAEADEDDEDGTSVPASEVHEETDD